MVIPKRLVQSVNLESEICVIGLDTKIEIWDKKQYEKSHPSSENFAELAEKILGNLGNL
ncbi:MAG: division/cell wall cluster transcriptional repressor MraZ [Bacteroidales bacterium]|nr:division/cell wall cluster transcriptional repressor MraZ [Bacteroidales bacterium]